MNSNLSYGLNARNKRKKGGLTSFGGDSSDSDDDSGGAPGKKTAASNRSDVNKAIAAEQAALRKRAEAAMAKSAADSNVYDYDAEYDNFSSGKKKEDESSAAKAKAAQLKNEPNKKPAAPPRYISNLLKSAQRRNQEQEIIHERQVQKEQAAEDAALQYEGKDRFVTSGYKRKLAEREQWAKEEAERTRKEEEEDVTKKSKGVGSFMFGGIGRSMLMGGDGEKDGDGGEDRLRKRGENDSQERVADDGDRGKDDDYQRHDSSRSTERWGSSRRCRDARAQEEYSERNPPPMPSHGNEKKDSINAQSATVVVKTRQQILQEREVTIREARERYFKRRGVVAQ